MAGEPPIVVEGRKELTYLLCQAAELEHGLMCEYLYAAFSQVLAHAAVDLMFGAIKPLGLLLARLPAGPDHPGVTAGASFQLPYRASFLLPHRRSAWLRFAERLDELSGFAAGLHPPTREDAVAAVSAALATTATGLMAHVEAV